MLLSDLVKISLSIVNPPNLQTGFSTGLITGSSNRLGSGVLVAFFANLSAVAAVFQTSDPEYVAAEAYFAQTPTPTNLAIGERTSAVAQISTVTVNTATAAHVYIVNVFGQNASYTAQMGDTTTDIATGLAAAISALTAPQYEALTVTHASAIVTLTAQNAGIAFTISTADALMTVATGTPANGLYQDLLNITQYNVGGVVGNNFVPFTNTGETDIDIWTGNQFAISFQKIQIAKIDESNALLGTDALINALFALSGTTGTLMAYYGATNGYAQYADAALMGGLVTQNPGSWSANTKVLNGITPDAGLNAPQRANLLDKNVNFYSTIGTQPFFINGKMMDGNGMDIYYGLYAFTITAQINIITAQAALPKFPFDNDGLAIIHDALKQAGDQFAGPNYKFFSDDPTTGLPYQIGIPPLNSFTSNQRKTGNLTGVTFSGHLAGDVLTTSITGQVYY